LAFFFFFFRFAGFRVTTSGLSIFSSPSKKSAARLREIFVGVVLTSLLLTASALATFGFFSGAASPLVGADFLTFFAVDATVASVPMDQVRRGL